MMVKMLMQIFGDLFEEAEREIEKNTPPAGEDGRVPAGGFWFVGGNAYRNAELMQEVEGLAVLSPWWLGL